MQDFEDSSVLVAILSGLIVCSWEICLPQAVSVFVLYIPHKFWLHAEGATWGTGGRMTTQYPFSFAPFVRVLQRAC